MLQSTSTPTTPLTAFFHPPLPGAPVRQVLWLLALEVPLYAANAQLVAGRWSALDVGGSITIHAFGAIYGLAAAVWLSPPGAGSAHPKNGASYVSDITAMLGTLFLWIYWPSFNGALASEPVKSLQPQAFCVMNTVLALLGATLAGVAASVAAGGKVRQSAQRALAAGACNGPRLLRGDSARHSPATPWLLLLAPAQLDMVHVQNATLAGGVAIGSSADLHMPPAAALAGERSCWAKSTSACALRRISPTLCAAFTVGIVAGTLSTCGYILLSPALEKAAGISDTCGVANLHGAPGILGGLASALFSWLYYTPNKPLITHGHSQPLVQLAGLGATIASATLGGLLVGWVVSRVDLAHQSLEEERYEDAVFWHEVEHED